MPRPYRVFMTGKSVEDVRRRAKRRYSAHTVVDVKLDPKKRPSRSAIAKGNTKYYRVYLKEKR